MKSAKNHRFFYTTNKQKIVIPSGIFLAAVLQVRHLSQLVKVNLWPGQATPTAVTVIMLQLHKACYM